MITGQPGPTLAKVLERINPPPDMPNAACVHHDPKLWQETDITGKGKANRRTPRHHPDDEATAKTAPATGGRWTTPQSPASSPPTPTANASKSSPYAGRTAPDDPQGPFPRYIAATDRRST